VAELLAALVPALERADAAGSSLAHARAAVAASSLPGWSVETEAKAAPRRRGGLPVVPPDARPGESLG
jgi:hypothetical protein